MTILTTHVGSLPRSKKLSDLLFKKENNKMYDEDSFNKVVKESVFDIVKNKKKLELILYLMGKCQKYLILLM